MDNKLSLDELQSNVDADFMFQCLCLQPIGLVKRIEVIENELPEFLKTFLQQYKETLANISGQIEKSNKRYDDQKIRQQIDQVKDLMGTMPKVITLKTNIPTISGHGQKTSSLV